MVRNPDAELGEAVCRALGLDPSTIQAVTIRLAVGELPRVTVEHQAGTITVALQELPQALEGYLARRAEL